jgi:hypothetical protein
MNRNASTSHSDSAAQGRFGGAAASSLIGVLLIATWLTVYTIGSQLPHSRFHEMIAKRESQSPYAYIMLGLTTPQTSIVTLAVFASCLGMWRNRNRGDTFLAGLDAYVSAMISGFLAGLLVCCFHLIAPKMLDYSPDQGTYNSLGPAASALGFYSGYDRNLIDGLVKRWFDALLKRSVDPQTSLDLETARK